MPGLDKSTLDDYLDPRGYWARGIVRSGRREGPYDMVDVLLDDAGDPFRRGGSALKSNAGFGSSGLTWLWEGDLIPGHRTVFANSADFGVLAADDATPINLGGSGVPAPVRATVFRDYLTIEQESGSTRVHYGGSRKTADYSTGTETVTEDSAIVTGAGTAWLANVDPGMLYLDAVLGWFWVVKSVDSDTQVTLSRPFTGATTAGSNGVFYHLFTTPSAPDNSAGVVATVSGRRLRVKTDNPTEINFTNIEQDAADAGNYHRISTGVVVVGIMPLRDVAVVFTTRGVWGIYGLANELSDPAGNALQSIQQINRDIILWHRSGIVDWRGQLIVPALDGVWLMDTVSGPTRISADITDLYRSYVKAGYRPGGAEVYNNRYHLPVLDSSANVIDHLVCRLTETRTGPAFRWTRLAGSGANVAALAARGSIGSAGPVLLGAGRQSSSRVLALEYGTPSAAIKNDHDGTTPQPILETGDLGTGNLVKNYVDRIRATYELTDAASDNPTLELLTSKDGAAFVSKGTKPESDGSAGQVWNTRVRARYLRLRFRVVGPAASFILRTVELFTRHSGRY